MNIVKKIIVRLIKRILPTKLYRIITNGCILVPKYYKDFIKEAEKNRNYTLENSNAQAMLLARKYGHILDKGLQNKNAEPGHSKQYYKLCVNSIKRLENSEYVNDPTLHWLKDIVTAYEKLQTEGKKTKNITYHEGKSTVTFDEIKKLIKQRRTNRSFQKRIISAETVDILLEMINWAANSCNKQPIRVFYTNNPNISTQCLKQCPGGTAFSEYIPCFLAFTADIRGYVWPSEIMLPYVDVSLGAQNFFLAATTLGISGCILSWAQKTGNQEAKLRQFLSIPDEYQIVFCAVIGYADYEYVAPARKKNIYHE